MHEYLLISVDELWLKGGNRSSYFAKMRSHVQKTLGRHLSGSWKLSAHNQRLIARSEAGFPLPLLNALSRLPGLHSLAPCLRVPQTMDEIATTALKEVKRHLPDDGAPLPFKVECRRVDKTFPVPSLEVNRLAGAKIVQELGERVKVDVHTPACTIHVIVLAPGVFIGSKKIAGAGGLPPGMSGHVVGLLSGGFDSPTAAYLMARRGCSQTLAFFHAWPFVGEEVVDKILALGQALTPYLGEYQLHVVPFGDIQKKIAQAVPPRLRTLFFRRYMVEAANLLAERVGAEALFTGDSLAQVSSQTLENLCLMDRISPRTVMRPLLSFNKREIIALAKEIGTHDISLRPQDDACALLSAKHPALRAKPDLWEKFAPKISLDGDVPQAIERAKIHHLFPSAP